MTVTYFPAHRRLGPESDRMENISHPCVHPFCVVFHACMVAEQVFLEFSHNSIWEALKSCNVDHEYVSLLRKFYKNQKASVQTDEESESFDIQKGSKQGDPMSSLLFNTVLQYSLKNEIQRWQKKKGIGNLLATKNETA